jgi:hypothetical protein
MQLAAERIRNSNDSLAAIAADVGYESQERLTAPSNE